MSPVFSVRNILWTSGSSPSSWHRRLPRESVIGGTAERGVILSWPAKRWSEEGSHPAQDAATALLPRNVLRGVAGVRWWSTPRAKAENAEGDSVGRHEAAQHTREDCASKGRRRHGDGVEQGDVSSSQTIEGMASPTKAAEAGGWNGLKTGARRWP